MASNATTTPAKNTPLLLVILDGFGLRDDAPEKQPDNAVAMAKMPCWRQLLQTYPMAKLDASEELVGLPHGQMGNSEVGHMNIGAGRVVMQELPRISQGFADGSFQQNPVWQELIATARQNKSRVHVIGLLSRGGVHGYQDHMAQVANLLAAEHISGWLHFITDGRDTAPQSAKRFWQDFQALTPTINDLVKPATLIGRYFAMDRDKNWQRTARAFAAIAHAVADNHADNVMAAVDHSYQQNINDEFIEPTIIDGYDGVKAGDVVLFMNFRADRARQLSTSLVEDDFNFFPRDNGDKKFIKPDMMAGLVEYSKNLSQKMAVLFAKEQFQETFGAVVAAHDLRQLRIAETEKYAHVTFFFNGGREEPYPKEDRILIPSPKVATYDLQPEMSAEAVTMAVLDSIDHKKHDVIILNYANADMVGHSGLMAPAVKALEKLDECLARLKTAIEKQQGIMIITADHGNIETMFDKTTNQPNTAHTLNLVPFMLVGDQQQWGNYQLSPRGKLADIAPTMLTLLGIAKPAAMTGVSLLVRK
ncbi:MAG: 2,3-bisphosphoglycerate-independent phosphoglycerate mutase [Hydrotalea sp.]|nr:2,3-bisphosphoglycerate-independent phosphoglycerate mutase [Hydrotalea sp.]